MVKDNRHIGSGIRVGDQVTYKGDECIIKSIDVYVELEPLKEKYPQSFFISTSDPDLNPKRERLSDESS